MPRQGLGPVDAIRAIRAAGGLASLAHFAEAPRHIPFIRELMAAGLNGLEVYYRSYEPPTVDQLRQVALELRLVATGGTDYHGDRETYAEAHSELWFPTEAATAFRAAIGGAAASDGWARPALGRACHALR